MDFGNRTDFKVSPNVSSVDFEDWDEKNTLCARVSCAIWVRRIYSVYKMYHEQSKHILITIIHNQINTINVEFFSQYLWELTNTTLSKTTKTL